MLMGAGAGEVLEQVAELLGRHDPEVDLDPVWVRALEPALPEPADRTRSRVAPRTPRPGGVRLLRSGDDGEVLEGVGHAGARSRPLDLVHAGGDASAASHDRFATRARGRARPGARSRRTGRPSSAARMFSSALGPKAFRVRRRSPRGRAQRLRASRCRESRTRARARLGTEARRRYTEPTRGEIGPQLGGRGDLVVLDEARIFYCACSDPGQLGGRTSRACRRRRSRRRARLRRPCGRPRTRWTIAPASFIEVTESARGCRRDVGVGRVAMVPQRNSGRPASWRRNPLARRFPLQRGGETSSRSCRLPRSAAPRRTPEGFVMLVVAENSPDGTGSWTTGSPPERDMTRAAPHGQGRPRPPYHTLPGFARGASRRSPATSWRWTPTFPRSRGLGRLIAEDREGAELVLGQLRARRRRAELGPLQSPSSRGGSGTLPARSGVGPHDLTGGFKSDSAAADARGDSTSPP